MSLDELRKNVIFQNSVDTWIAFCQENNLDWYVPENYKKFIAFLIENNLSMKKFPLCVKETGGNYERGKDKTKFAEMLSQSNDPNAAAYTIKLNDATMNIIRKFNPN